MELVTVKTGSVDHHEVRRYMGYYHVPGWEKQPGDVLDSNGKEAYADTDALIERAVKLCEGVLENRVLFDVYPLTIEGKNIRFGHTEFVSGDLAARLEGCHELVLFAATGGFGLDRIIEKYKRMEPSLAYALSMVGTEHTEALCDGFCAALEQKEKEKGNEVTLRYSPGYGDLDLSVQKDIFRELDLTRKLGVTLNESMLMTPVKSVTAIAGIRTVKY